MSTFDCILENVKRSFEIRLVKMQAHRTGKRGSRALGYNALIAERHAGGAPEVELRLRLSEHRIRRDAGRRGTVRTVPVFLSSKWPLH